MGGYICVTLGEQNMLYFLPTRTDFAVFRKENNLGGQQAFLVLTKKTSQETLSRICLKILPKNLFVPDRF